jgi:hypothetical protein
MRENTLSWDRRELNTDAEKSIELLRRLRSLEREDFEAQRKVLTEFDD